MGNTRIDYADKAWELTRGCQHVSAGCAHCWAERITPRLPGTENVIEKGKWTGVVECLHEKLGEPLHWHKPRIVFVNSRSDLFHESVPFSFIDKALAVMALRPQHTFLVLTKRPGEMFKYLVSFGDAERAADRLSNVAGDLLGTDAECRVDNHINGWSMNLNAPDNNPCDGTVPRWPLPHVWFGVSVEDEPSAKSRLDALMQCPVAHRFVSYEPALGPVDFGPWIDRLGWIIMGGESGDGARPMHPQWARDVRDKCKAAGVPFYFKQGSATPEWPRFKDFSSFPADLQIRETPWGAKP